MNTSDQASQVLTNINKSAEALSQNKPGARERLLDLSHQLTAVLETPSEAIQRIGWAEPARFAALKLAIDLKIFDSLENAEGASVSVSELAASTGAEHALLARTLKHLSAMNVIKEPDVDEFTSTPFSRALTLPKFRDGISYCFNVAGPSFHSIPAFLKQISYQNPTNIADGPFQKAHNTKDPFFVWLRERPEHFVHFNNYMSGYRQGKQSWMDEGVYPVEERLVSGAREGEGEVFVVDVGGGLGHDLEELRGKLKRFPGRLVLQDQPEVIAQINPPPSGIDITAHDFFTPQPIKGARAYYLHSVLHDWDDPSSITILRNIIPAMQPGYSKLLIHEYVVPNLGATWPVTSMDWLMMALGAVKERTEGEWRALLGEAGLEVTGIWSGMGTGETLIECVV